MTMTAITVHCEKFTEYCLKSDDLEFYVLAFRTRDGAFNKMSQHNNLVHHCLNKIFNARIIHN